MSKFWMTEKGEAERHFERHFEVYNLFFFAVKVFFPPFRIFLFNYAFILYIFKVDDYLGKPLNLYNKSAE